jgi:hypothetical protein
VNQNSYKSLQFSLSGLWFWLTILAVIWLLGSIGLGWLVKSVLILVGLLLIAPVVAFFVFRWWLQRNLVEGQCPVCGYEMTGVNGIEIRCPSCSEPLKIEKGQFERITPPGTVDIDAVEVSVKQIED